MAQLWYKKPEELFSPSKLLRFYPSKDMDCAERFNATTRFIIYSSLIALWRDFQPKNVFYVGGAAIGLLIASQNCVIEKTVEQMDVAVITPKPKPESYLTKQKNEPFPGARDVARRLVTSTRETPGRSVIASTALERKYAFRPVSTAKSIDSKEYNYMSGAVAQHKRVMNVI